LISIQGINELQRKGLVKAIGVSNFFITKTERLLQTAKIAPSTELCRVPPLLPAAKAEGIL